MRLFFRYVSAGGEGIDDPEGSEMGERGCGDPESDHRRRASNRRRGAEGGGFMRLALIGTSVAVILLAVAAAYILPSIEASEKPQPHPFTLAR